MALAIAAAVGAGAGGGAAGALLAQFIGGYHAQRLEEQLARGGILLWVRTPDRCSERLACNILERNGGAGVHLHDLPAPEVSRSEGGVSDTLALVDRPIAAWWRRPADPGTPGRTAAGPAFGRKA